MEVKAILRLRNNHMIAARKKKGWSQKELAIRAGVPIWMINCLERFSYPKTYQEDCIGVIGVLLGIDAENVYPKELVGEKIQADYVGVQDVPTDLLLEAARTYNTRYILPSPEMQAEQNDDIEQVKNLLPELTYREREILKLRFGLGRDKEIYTPMEIGRILRITRERVGQVEAKAIRKLQNRLKRQ